jgi:hypothetical protein
VPGCRCPAGPGTKAESSFRHAIDPLSATAASRQISEHRRRCRVAVSGIESRGPRLVGKLDAYRRYARECLEMASAVSDPRARASLLQMAQVWFRLAERALPAETEESHQVDG